MEVIITRDRHFSCTPNLSRRRKPCPKLDQGNLEEGSDGCGGALEIQGVLSGIARLQKKRVDAFGAPRPRRAEIWKIRMSRLPPGPSGDPRSAICWAAV